MTTQNKHTRLPWRFAKATGIAAQYGIFSNATHACIAGVHKIHKTGVAEANAEFINRACNSHYELVESVLDLAEQLEAALSRLGVCGQGDGKDHKADASSQGGSGSLERARRVVVRATGKEGA